MGTLDLFDNPIVEEPVETPISNDSFEFFNFDPEKSEETPVEQSDDLVLNVKEKNLDVQGRPAFTNSIYFGKTIDYCGIWEPGKMYYNNNYRISFVTFDNFLLVCNQTHESSEETKPVIEYYEGTPMGVKNIQWSIVLTGSDSGGDTITIERNLANLKKIVYANSDTIGKTSSIVGTLGTNVNETIVRTDNLEKDNVQNKKNIVDLQKILSANIMYPIILTEDEYDALLEKDPNKFYYVYEE